HYNKQKDGSPDYASVTFGKGKGSAPVAVHNVADGKIAKGSHDAVNGSQLFETNQNVTSVKNNLDQVAQKTSEYLGGGASFKNG
ncbi:MAG: hypothetical protein PV354_11660, partial [Bartonella sp.]|nr:hypothetical protein [Bartonella sp.]